MLFGSASHSKGPQETLAFYQLVQNAMSVGFD